jgi:hypothetical protein
MNTITQWPNAISEQKKNALIQLIYSNTQDNTLEEWLSYLESASEEDTDEITRILNVQV